MHKDEIDNTEVEVEDIEAIAEDVELDAPESIEIDLEDLEETTEVEDETIEESKTEEEVTEENNFKEDLEALVATEEGLSEGFRSKASIIFEAALGNKVATRIQELEEEYKDSLETEVTKIHEELVETVDSYLGYVVEQWVKDNEVAIQNGLRTEIAEDFIESLKTVFTENYIEVPQGKVDLVDELADQVTELEEKLNTTTEANIRLSEEIRSGERKAIIAEASVDLADTEAEKLANLVEDVDFDSVETFKMKVDVIRENYFDKEPVSDISESEESIALENENGNISDAPDTGVMSHYTKALTK